MFNAFVASKKRKSEIVYFVVVKDSQNPNGRWVSDPNTGKAFATKKEAKKHMAKLVNANSEGKYVQPNKILFSDLLDNYLATIKRTIAESTFVKYEQLVRVHIKPNLGHIPAQKLTAQNLNDLYASLLERGKVTQHSGGKGLAANSVRHIHVCINACLDQALKHDLIVKNVAQFATPPRQEKKRKTIFTLSEINKFFDGIIGEEFEFVYRFIAKTGCRRGEALGLTWRNVDWVNSTVTIEQALKRIKGKVVMGSPKTKNSFRTYQIDSELLRDLDTISQNQQKAKMALGAGYNDQDLVFCEMNGNRINPNRVYEHYRRLIRKLGLPSEVRLHDLRGLHITLLLSTGTNPKYVAERVGDSVETVMNFYAQSIGNDGIAAMDRLEKLLEENRKSENRLKVV